MTLPGWAPRLTLPAGAVVFMGASTPWIAQRLPRFVFPALAVGGGALAALWFARSFDPARARLSERCARPAPAAARRVRDHRGPRDPALDPPLFAR